MSTFTTLPSQNDQQIYNLIYTHTVGQWSFTPYFQYTSVPDLTALGLGGTSSTYGGRPAGHLHLRLQEPGGRLEHPGACRI